MAVAGTVRRLDIAARLYPAGDGDEQLHIPDRPALPHRLGATTALRAWLQRAELTCGPSGSRSESAVLARSNGERSRAAAARTAARVTTALQRPGDTVPVDLADTARFERARTVAR